MVQQLVERKLAFLAETLTKLRALPQSSVEEFCRDDRNPDAALFRLDVAIHALSDILGHLAATLGPDGPGGPRAAIEQLERDGRLPSGVHARYVRWFSLREQIADPSKAPSDSRVFCILTSELAELDELAALCIDALTSPD